MISSIGADRSKKNCSVLLFFLFVCFFALSPSAGVTAPPGSCSRGRGAAPAGAPAPQPAPGTEASLSSRRTAARPPHHRSADPGPRGGWDAHLAGSRLVPGATSARQSSRTSLRSGRPPSTQVVPARGSPSKLAAMALCAVTERKADHRLRKALSVPARSPSGTARTLALDCDLIKSAVSLLQRPPPTSAARANNRQRLPLTSSG